MASLVAEALSSAAYSNKESLSQEIQKLSNKIELIKADVITILDNCYGSISPVWIDGLEQSERLDAAAKETSTIRNKIELDLKPNLENAISKSDSVTREIEQTTLLTKVVLSLVNIHSCLEEAETARMCRKYEISALKLDEIFEKISEIQRESFKDLKICQSLKTEHLVKKEQLIYELGELWKQKFIWKFPSEENSAVCKLIINLSTKVEDREQVKSFLSALHSLKNLERKMKLFGQSLMSSFVEPIISSDVLLEIHQSSSTIFSITQINSTNKPAVKTVSDNLHSLFSALHSVLNHNVYGLETPPINLLNLVGKYHSTNFNSALIKQCLEPAVPNESKDLEEYSSAVATIVQLDEALQSFGFLDGKESSVMHYAKNHDSLFANKICQDILSKSRNKMKSDLFVTIDITPAVNIKNENEKSDSAKDDLILEALELPACKISKFISEILEILHETLGEACNSSSISATRLYFTARHIIEMFCDVVPVYHSTSIIMFPQQTAVHHNNCMYLADKLLTIGKCYKVILQSTWEGLGNFQTVTFVDLADKLRRIGTAAFLEQMRKQRQQLLDFLQGSGVFQDMANDVNFLEKGEICVKQCLLHLNSLRNVWIEILPNHVYLKAIGTLSNSCLEEIILRVVTQEDITEKATKALDLLFNKIIREMPLLFVLENKTKVSEFIVCQRHIKKWQKFQELKQILVSNLNDIVDRWASGMGPLAEEFSPNEVKQLIRALFQNTERRSKALASIR